MNNKTDMERIGLFEELGYVSIGQPYKTVFSGEISRESMKGRQILGEGLKSKAGNNDGYFGDFIRTFDELYCDPNTRRRKHRMKMKGAKVGGNWVPASGYKEHSGLASCYGTFGGVCEHFSGLAFNSKAKGPGKKNVVTNPGKKGTGYGYVDVAINQYPESKHEIYRGPQGLTTKENKNYPGAIQNRNPFLNSVHRTGFFDQNPFREAEIKGRHPNRRRGGGFGNLLEQKPFIPSDCTKKDGGCKDGCINAFPSYDPSTVFKESMPIKSVNVVNSSGRTYIPIPAVLPKSLVSPSIMYTNLARSLNWKNIKSMKSVMHY